MKKTIVTLAIALFAVSCTDRTRQAMSRNYQFSAQFSDRNYSITVYSGGKPVFEDSFHGMINQEKGSDGIFYFKGDTLIELSGEYVIKSTK
jgi:hypothetical protein